MEDRVAFVVLVVMGGAVLLAVLSLPGVIARRRNHADTKMVGTLSLWGILIPPLWLIALVWAMFGERERQTHGPGYFDVQGVDANGADVRLTIGADSPANAKVKAEQRGVTVTDVFAAT